MADCVNSSPPFPENFRDSAEFGRFRGNFGKTQGNLVEFSGGCMALNYEFSGNSWKISGQRRVFGKICGLGVSGNLGPQKAFAQRATGRCMVSCPQICFFSGWHTELFSGTESLTGTVGTVFLICGLRVEARGLEPPQRASGKIGPCFPAPLKTNTPFRGL